jgi:hypothetical protein
MVQRFRKKPVVVEAIQFTGENTKECMEFCRGAIKFPDGLIKTILIQTTDGNRLCGIGDYIVKEVDDKFYICKHDIFYSIYESDDSPQSKTPIVLFDKSLLRDDVTEKDIANKITIINK